MAIHVNVFKKCENFNLHKNFCKEAWYEFIISYIWIERDLLKHIQGCPSHCFFWSCFARRESPCRGLGGSHCCYYWSWRWTWFPRSPVTSLTAGCCWGQASYWPWVVSVETYWGHPPFVETGNPHFLEMSQTDLLEQRQLFIIGLCHFNNK